ncbi:hypothetical protein FGG08_006735 [Glutinoglossum americanum]|uniref:Uncharacterized protein n=1 Tax=Glutinoglossum americanum TaxID=1670608 RepID=A0A9P8HXP5_9PEZI|nr:hypothetical protein FGG08_006735 [Glutinoglossum americanum]
MGLPSFTSSGFVPPPPAYGDIALSNGEVEQSGGSEPTGSGGRLLQQQRQQQQQQQSISVPKWKEWWWAWIEKRAQRRAQATTPGTAEQGFQLGDFTVSPSPDAATTSAAIPDPTAPTLFLTSVGPNKPELGVVRATIDQLEAWGEEIKRQLDNAVRGEALAKAGEAAARQGKAAAEQGESVARDARAEAEKREKEALCKLQTEVTKRRRDTELWGEREAAWEKEKEKLLSRIRDLE